MPARPLNNNKPSINQFQVIWELNGVTQLFFLACNVLSRTKEHKMVKQLCVHVQDSKGKQWEVRGAGEAEGVGIGGSILCVCIYPHGSLDCIP